MPADRVLVVPNMNGIIAVFDRLPRPGNLRDGEPFLAPLTIWTSQGHVQLPRLIEVEYVRAPTRQRGEAMNGCDPAPSAPAQPPGAVAAR